MFKTPRGEHANSDSIPMLPNQDYRISIDDKITFTLSTNNGTTIIESLSGSNTANGSSAGASSEYIVRRNGNVELPKLGEIKAEGMTIAAFEDTLQRLFSKEYQEPFVQVRVTNQRVIVFPGNGSDARVIPLTNNNTTLMEVIAAAGGISERGKARSIKLMRRENNKRKIYLIDLSTIDGLKFVDMVVQANDYVYIEPNPEISRGILKEVSPIVSILSSSLVIFTVLKNL